MKRWNESDDPKVWKLREGFLRSKALRRMRPPMRAKYASQIRRGVMRAKFEVDFTIDFGVPPKSYYVPKTDLEKKAYDRTLPRLVALEILSMGSRILNKVYEKWPETKPDGQDR